MKKNWKELLLLLCAALLLLGAGCGRSPAPETEPAPTEPAPHVHIWDNGVCETCGAVCAHEWKDGVCAVCGTVCAHEWKDGVCAVCGAVCAHEWKDGVCAVCGAVCTHEWKDGVCSVCGMACAHEWEDGVCSVCGMACAHEQHDAESGLCSVCGMKTEHRYRGGVCEHCGKELVFNTKLIDYPVEVKTETDEKGRLDQYHFMPGQGEVLPGMHPTASPEDNRMRDMVVYTPYGYDEEKPYNVLIIAPGAGHTGHQWMEKPTLVNASLGRIKGCDLLDRLIAAEKIEPLIVVEVEYYLRGTPAEIAVRYDWDLRERVLPFLAENYGTYASVDEDGTLIPSPEHFAFAGYSYGAMIGWQMLPGSTDLFAYWSLISGGFQNDEELADARDAGVGADEPILYLYTGDGSMAEGWEAYRHRVEKLSKVCRCVEDGINLSFILVDDVEHGYQCCNTGLYNSLQIFFHGSLDPEALPPAETPTSANTN